MGMLSSINELYNKPTSKQTPSEAPSSETVAEEHPKESATVLLEKLKVLLTATLSRMAHLAKKSELGATDRTAASEGGGDACPGRGRRRLLRGGRNLYATAVPFARERSRSRSRSPPRSKSELSDSSTDVWAECEEEIHQVILALGQDTMTSKVHSQASNDGRTSSEETSSADISKLMSRLKLFGTNSDNRSVKGVASMLNAVQDYQFSVGVE